MFHANQPQAYNYRGHAIALEVQNNGEVILHNIPVYMVTAVLYYR